MTPNSERDTLGQAEEKGKRGQEAFGNQQWREAIELFREVADDLNKMQEFFKAGSYYMLLGQAYEKVYYAIRKGREDLDELPLTGRENVCVHIDAMRCAEDGYQWARIAFQKGGYSAHASRANVYSQDARRKAVGQMFWHEKGWERVHWLFYDKVYGARAKTGGYFWLTISKLTCNYGGSPTRLLPWIGCLILLFAMAYYPNPWGRGFIQLGGVEWSGKPLSFDDLVTALHFSVITFATLGYGDIYPANTLARLLTLVEVLLGYAIFGVLIAFVVKKIGAD